LPARYLFDPKRYRIEWIGHFEDEQRAEARFGLILGLMIVLLYAGTGTNPGEKYSLKPDEMNLLSWTPRASRKPCHTMATHSLQLSGNH
jgi:hypothetical protein